MLKASVIVPFVRSPRKTRTLVECSRRLARQDWPRYQVVYREGGVEAERSALAKADGDVVLFTDSDCYVEEDWVRRHMEHYPGVDMVMGAPTRAFKFLSFRNFSVKREVVTRLGLRDCACHDFDFALRLKRSGLPFRYALDPSIRVVHDDREPVPADKMFSYAVNVVLLMRRHGVLPSREDLVYLRDPRVLLGAMFALVMPTSSPFRAFRRLGRYRSDTEY